MTLLKHFSLMLLFAYPALPAAAGLPPEIQIQVDSIANLLQNTHDDTTRADLYFTLAEVTYYADQLIGMEYNRMACLLAEQNLDNKKNLTNREKHVFRTILGFTWNNMGYVFQAMGIYDSALYYLDKSYKLQESIGDREGMALAINNLGLLHHDRGDPVKALACFEKSLSMANGIHDSGQIAQAFNNIGMIHKEQGNIPLALEFLHKGLMIQEKLGDKPDLASSFANIGLTYHELKDFENAEKFYLKSLEMLEGMGETARLADQYWNLANLYGNYHDTAAYVETLKKSAQYYRQCNGDYCKGSAYYIQATAAYSEMKYDSSIFLFRKVLYYYKKIDHQDYIERCYTNIAKNYIKLGDFQSARSYTDSSMALALDLGNPMKLDKAASLYASIYKKTGDWEQALKYAELHIKMKDSVSNQTNQKAVIRQQTKYEFEKALLVKAQEEKERLHRDEEAVNRRNNLQYSIVLICLLLLGGSLTALGRFSVPVRVAEGLIFFSFLIFFEFLLVLADPYIEDWSAGAPGIKLLFNAGVAALIFPLHSFFESKLKYRLSGWSRND